ncbi:MAG: glycosyl transferase, partial [Candidatus Firestonebacteria bacterium]|nr:glycosyl transferase [Candidatus Firestonebacteria bacterium]
DTPLPWINYLGAQQYCALMSNTAGGYSFHIDPRERRILRYRYNSVPYDRPGRYLYLRDAKTQKYWSLSWQPTQHDLKKYKYECRHGLGYTKITSHYEGIETETTYFVPLNANLEIWKVKIKNLGKNVRHLGLFSYAEFCLWDAFNDMTDFQYNLNIGEATYKNGTIYHLTKYRVEKNLFAFFDCNAKVTSYDTDRATWLGPYRSEANPRSVEQGVCANSKAMGWSPIGAHGVILSLKPGEEQEIVFQLGVGKDLGDEKPVIQKFRKLKNVEAALTELRAFWQKNLQNYQVETPDEQVNAMVNVWNQYQCRTTFNWSRSASYYESGIGRGMGFRDSNQDTLGFVHQIPAEVKARLCDIAATQFPDGSAHHQYSPLTKKGNGGGYSDDHLWLIYSVCEYIRETGDFEFAAQSVPYNDGSQGTLQEHMERALEYTLAHLGAHGLPLMGNADWNDCLTLKPGGESVMVAQMFVLAARELAGLLERLGNDGLAGRCRQYAEAMKETINQKAWDGEWYVRAFTGKQQPVGSRTCAEGKIHLNAQSWGVLSGTADRERAESAMNAVEKHLATKYGIVLLWPAYKSWDNEVGAVTLFPEGLKENAAIFCHPNPWAMIAETMLGRGEQAMKYYKAILPINKNEMAEIHRTEPYVYSQMIAGKESPKFGEAKNSWLTGTAAWNFVAISKYILGVRPQYDGLQVDPCIPAGWKRFVVRRFFRGAWYNIEVKNPRRSVKGDKSMRVNGVLVEGNVIPILPAGKEHKIEVVMGV